MPNEAESPHDVLAADEFAMPVPDPALHRGPVSLPDDPTGIAEPHDVLAAEEFALPAPPAGWRATLVPRAASGRRAVWTAAAALALALATRLWRGRQPWPRERSNKMTGSVRSSEPGHRTRPSAG